MTFAKTLKTFVNLREIKFLYAVSGIYSSYIFYGVIQEKIYKTDYGKNAEGKSVKFEFAFALILVQMFIASILSGVQLIVNKIKFVCNVREAFFLGLFNFVGMLSSNTALKMVSYPLQALTKSCKILSVLLVGFLTGNVSFTIKQYICGGIITFGILIFNLFDGNVKADKESSLAGIALLSLSLCSDGGLATIQSKLLSKEKPISNWEMMFHIALFGFIFSLFFGFFMFKDFYYFVLDHPFIIQQILTLGLMGGIGQCFIFYCIKQRLLLNINFQRCFSPRILSIVTTTRKFFTVLFSIAYFGHIVSIPQFVAIAIVAIGIGLELFGDKKHTKKT